MPRSKGVREETQLGRVRSNETESSGYPSSLQSSQSSCSLCNWAFGSEKTKLRRDNSEVMALGRWWPARLIFTDTPCRLGALMLE